MKALIKKDLLENNLVLSDYEYPHCNEDEVMS